METIDGEGNSQGLTPMNTEMVSCIGDPINQLPKVLRNTEKILVFKKEVKKWVTFQIKVNP